MKPIMNKDLENRIEIPSDQLGNIYAYVAPRKGRVD